MRAYRQTRRVRLTAYARYEPDIYLHLGRNPKPGEPVTYSWRAEVTQGLPKHIGSMYCDDAELANALDKLACHIYNVAGLSASFKVIKLASRQWEEDRQTQEPEAVIIDDPNQTELF